STVGARGVALLSDRPTVRRSDRFGGNRMPGSTSTMSIKMNARMMRRSTGPLCASASARLCVCASVRLALWHRIEAARVQRMTAQDALQAEPAPLERAVALDGIERVLRARRHETTLREHQMRERHLVCANHAHGGPSRPTAHAHVSRLSTLLFSSRIA